MTKRGGWPSTGFGERLREFRSAAGLSQRELAERAGCNLFTVAKLERGSQEPAWPLVLALAGALGIGCQEFIGGEKRSGASPNRPRGRPPKPQGVESVAAGDSPRKRK